MKANARCPMNNLDIYLEFYILFYKSTGYSDTDPSYLDPFLTDPSPSPDPFPTAPTHPRVESWTALQECTRALETTYVVAISPEERQVVGHPGPTESIPSS